MCIRDSDYRDNNKHLPGVRISVLVTADGYDDESINYLTEADNTNGDWTKNTKVDTAYDKIIKNDPINYCYGLTDKVDLNRHYIQKGNIINLNKNELCMFNIRLIFDDGG